MTENIEQNDEETKEEQVSDEVLSGLYTAAKSFPHVADDWNTVEWNPPIKSIRYDLKKIPKDKRPGYRYYDLKHNLHMARKALTKDDSLMSVLFAQDESKIKRGVSRLLTAYAHMRMTHNHLPDATAFNGSIISFWGEHADYIGAVAPHTVAPVFKELIDAREMKRILAEKAANGETLTSDEITTLLETTVEHNGDDWDNYGALIDREFETDDENDYENVDDDGYYVSENLYSEDEDDDEAYR